MDNINFKEGNIVKLNSDAKFGDILRDIDTDLLKTVCSGTLAVLSGQIELYFDEEYTVKYVPDWGQGRFVCLAGIDEVFDSCLFTLVHKNEKIKEVTKADIEKKFGCKVKIVRGAKNE